MSEKRLSFIIDPAKAKTGAEQIKQSLRDVTKIAKDLQRTLGSLDMTAGSGTGGSKGVDATARAMKNAANSTQFWEQRLKDLDTTQYKHLVQTRETARQVEAYQKSLVNALTPAQRMAKAENELSKQYQSGKVQVGLYEKGLAQKNIKQRESVALQKQLAQSQARLAQTYTKEYADLIRNNAAIQKRRRELLGLDDAQKKTSLSADRLRTAALAIGGAFGVFSFGHIAAEAVRMADAYTGVQNRLAVVAGATTDLTQATRELLDVSIRSRTALDTTMDVYAKMIRVTKDMSFENKDLLRVTESVSKAVAMSGASAQGAEGALLQFSQALSGNFQASAQELNSIIEQTPAVAQLMADALNKVDPSINATLGNLKRLATEGRFSTEMLLEGILLMSDGIDEQFGRATRTVSQSLQALRDSVMVTFGEIDKAFGGSGSLAEGITEVAESLGDFKAEIAGAGAAVATFIGTTAGLGLAALAISIGAIAGVILSVAAALGGLAYLFVKNKTDTALLKAEVDKLTTSNDLLAKSYDTIKDSYAELSATEIGIKMADIQAKVAESSSKLAAAQKELEYMSERDIYDRTDVKEQIKLVDRLRREHELHTTQLGRLREAGIKAFGDDVIGGMREYIATMLGVNKETEGRIRTVDDVVSALDSEINAESNANRQRAESILLTRAYAIAKEQGVEVTTEFVEKVLAESKLIRGLQNEFRQTSSSTRDWKSDLDSLRKSLDPTYAALRDKQDAMEIINKTISKSSPLYKELADAIDQRYTKAVRDATGASKELTEPLSKVARVLDGTQAYYDQYYANVTRIVNAQGDAAEKARLIQQEFAKLNEGVTSQQGPSYNDILAKFDPDVAAYQEYYAIVQQINDAQISMAEKANLTTLAYQELQSTLGEDYWTNWLETTRESMATFDEIAGGALETFKTSMGSAFEAMIFDAQTLSESIANIGEAILRSVVNAIGQWVAQWISMQLVQMAFGNTMQAATVATGVATGSALAAAYAPAAAMASLASFGANSAPAMAGITATSALTQSLSMLGMAHDGIDSIPQTGTWLLEKGERVTTANTSAKLDRTLSRIESDMDEGTGGRSGKGGAVVNQTINVTGTIDNRTSSQIARDASRRQRLAENRFGK
jgi:tape measure domain-containing protein